MPTTKTEWIHLERDPHSSYLQLSIRGRRIRARTLYGAYKSADEPRTPEEIAADYDLPLDAVLEAIAYCESNPPEVQLDQARENALAEAVGMNHPEYRASPAKYYRRLSSAEYTQRQRES